MFYLEVHLVELSQVGPHHLITVHKDHARHIQGEEHIQEQDLVGPDDALLVSLLHTKRDSRAVRSSSQTQATAANM